MAKFDKKLEAIELRKKGLSIGVIATKLGVSKSSSSLWCADIVLPKKFQKQLMENRDRGRLMGALTNKNRKRDNIKLQAMKARSYIKSLSSREILIAATALYWAEGAKSDTTSGFSFMNSDPKMIIFMKSFLTFVMSVKEENIICTIQINIVHKPRIGKVLKFWSKSVKITIEAIQEAILCEC